MVEKIDEQVERIITLAELNNLRREVWIMKLRRFFGKPFVKIGFWIWGIK